MDDKCSRKSKSDIIRGEGNEEKMTSPKRPKRSSLANELCLPKITESGEIQHESIHDISRVQVRGGANNVEKFTALDKTEGSNSDISEVLEKVVEDSTEKENIIPSGRTKRPSKVSLYRNDGPTESEKGKSNSTNDKREHTEEVLQRKTVENQKLPNKYSAINKLVKENTKDILNVFEKIRSARRLNESTEMATRCRHAKLSTPDNGDEQEHCLICKITNAAEKFTSIDTNRFLVEILYPHDFYDKYSRSRRKLAGLETNTQPLQMPIVKPARVIRKSNLSVSTLPKESNPNEDSLHSEQTRTIGTSKYLNKHCEHVKDRDSSPVRHRLYGDTELDKSTIHSKCREGTHAVFIIENSNHEKPVLKGLKGTVRKEHSLKDKLDRNVSQSMYEVNSLGMQFALPEYNGSLRNRQSGGSRDFHFLSSSAHNTPSSPYHHSDFEDGNRRITPFSRTLQRGFTFAGFDTSLNNRQLPDPFTDNQREITRAKPKVDQATTSGKLKTGSKNTLKHSTSLPPIDNNSNIHNVFMTSGT